MFTIDRIAYRQEGVFFPTENALSAGEGGWECTARAKHAIYDCLVFTTNTLVNLPVNKRSESYCHGFGVFLSETQ